MLLGGISESTFRRFVKSGELDAFKLRTKVYVTGTEIARFLATRPSARKVA